jgi:uroporphyrinogen-III synthase
MRERLFKYLPDIIVFTSASTVDGFKEILSPEEIQNLTERAKVLSMGPSTTRALISTGFSASYEAKEHTIPGVIECLKKHFGPSAKDSVSTLPKE